MTCSLRVRVRRRHGVVAPNKAATTIMLTGPTIAQSGRRVRKAVRIPVAVKLSPFYSSLPAFVRDALVARLRADDSAPDDVAPDDLVARGVL